MMSSPQQRIVLATAAAIAAITIAPMTAQAQCDGGSCPITGGSLRTVVGGGFVIPQVTALAGIFGPTGRQMGYVQVPQFTPNATPNASPTGYLFTINTAMGFVLPTPNAAVTVPTGQVSAPFSFNIQEGQLTYGDATANTLSLMMCSFCPPHGRYTTPLLVQVPLFNFAPTFLGVSTNIGQSFPGLTRQFPPPSTGTPVTTIGGPVNFRAGGRPGQPTVNHCAGGFVPEGTIPGTWAGGCQGTVPTTGSGGTGVAITPAIVQYVRTANQFGGTATQRQVKRGPGVTDPTGATWLGRIRFNRTNVPYTVNDFVVDANPGPPFTPTPGTPPTPKTYPTQPQNLVEPVVWGADFGAIVQRLGAAPGDIVSGLVTPGGGPVNTATQVVRVTPPGAGQGRQATSTSWGGPMTTGKVVVQAIGTGTIPISTWTNTGNDQRTSMGQGMVNLVSGSLSRRTSAGVSVAGTQRTMLTLTLPEPSMALGLMFASAALAGVARRRSR